MAKQFAEKTKNKKFNVLYKKYERKCFYKTEKIKDIKYTQFKEVTLVVIENIYSLRKGDKLENIYRESFRYL